MEKYNIRVETERDYKDIYNLTKAAFTCSECADGTEQDLVENLRKGSSYIPELALVAELNGELVGHIMFSSMMVGDYKAVLLAPVSVSPDYQKQGIGGKLIARGHEKARELGYDMSILLGHSSYYPRFGYEMAAKYGITFPFEAPDECKMVKFLNAEPTLINSSAVFPSEFL